MNWGAKALRRAAFWRFRARANRFKFPFGERDDAPAAPEHPVSEPGDLSLLGRHRLLCGDSTVATDVERVLGGVEPHPMVTEPPYGVEYDPDWRNHAVRPAIPAGCRTPIAVPAS